MVDRDDGWTSVAEQRLALAEALDQLRPEDWDRQSACGDWRVRDVVGHLVHLAEGTRLSVFGDVVRQLRPPDQAISRIARREGKAEPATLVARLRAAADGRFVVPFLPPAAALGEVVVHGIDALRPAGASEPEVAAERSKAIAEVYRRIGPAFGNGLVAARIRFHADDAGWAVGPPDGPPAHGSAIDVVLALAGRRTGTAGLTGPGAQRLPR